AAERHDRSPDRLPRHDAGEQEPGRSAQLGRRRPPLGRQHVHRPRLLGVAHRGAVPGGDGEAAREDEEPQRVRHRLSALLGAAAGDRHDVHCRAAAETVMRSLVTVLAALACLASITLSADEGQTRFTYSSGQTVSPAYEGWTYNPDGTVTMYFGYMNTNWLQEFDVPVGPDNAIEPGGPDQGQPTHFYPRRSPFLFTIKVPKELGTKELIWTLTTNGKTEKAYASLKTDYQIDNQVISTEVGGDFGSLRDELRTNIPPELRIDGDKRRTAKVGEPLPLLAFAGDPDNLPARRDGKPQPRNASGRMMDETTPAPAAKPTPTAAAAAAISPATLLYRPPASIVPSSGPGLRFSWIVYRG